MIEKNKEQPFMLTTAAAANLCGVTIKRWRTWNSLGKIPSPLRIGKSLFWKRDELLRWIDEGCPIRKHWGASRDGRLVLPHRCSKPCQTGSVLPLGTGTKTHENDKKVLEKMKRKGLPSP